MNLEKMNLVEMNSQEIKEVEGGNPLAVFLVAVAWSAWDNFGDIREGWHDGVNGHPPRY